ncbi:MAG: DUF3102 domain-containing protein [Verrucomicrobiota bacterium]
MNTKRNTKLTEAEIQQLKQYAEQVNQLQTEIQSNDKLSAHHSKVALELAIKAGGFLNAAKGLLKHGAWKKWLAENVACICKRTAQNYMKLAKKVEERQYVALLTEAESLRQAYIRVGIINEKSDTEPANTEPANTEPTVAEPANKAMSPEKMKEKDKAQYDAKRNEARQKAILHVRETINASNKLNWNLSTWAVKNDKPCSGDEANYGAALFNELKTWVAKHEFQDLTREDEIITKTGIVLSEVVKSFILANTTTATEAPLVPPLAEIAPNYVMEFNGQSVEVAEPKPA